MAVGRTPVTGPGFSPPPPGPIPFEMATTPPDASRSPLAGRTVLVVDDEPHLTQIVAFNLRRAGATVTTARNGAEALAAVRQMAADGRRPDLLITDLQMPVMNGCELCANLSRDPATADIPTLMLTARGHKLAPAEMGASNIRRLMSKPFSTADLLAQSRDLLAASAATAAAATAAAA